MLEDQLLPGVAFPHLLDQAAEELDVGLVGLSSGGDELHLFAAVAADAHGAREVVRQVLLVVLVNQQRKTKVTSTRSPFLA